MPVIVAYAPCNYKEEVKDAFQREFERVIKDVNPREKLYVKGG